MRIYHYVLDVVQKWFKENRIAPATGWRLSAGERRGGANLAYIYKLINQVILYIHNIITYYNRYGTKIGQGAPRALARCSKGSGKAL